MSQSSAAGDNTGSPQESRLQKTTAGVFRILLYIGMSFVVAMMLLTVAHGFGRYALNMPIPGLMELSSVMLVSMVFLSLAYTQVVKGHVGIGTIVDRFPPRVQKGIGVFNYTVCLVMIVILVWQSISRGIYLFHEGSISTILKIPDYPFLFILSFGWVILGLAIVMDIAVNTFLKPRAK
jgi:TRAP-type C4-dicarboxylate transport system permease small subunit